MTRAVWLVAVLLLAGCTQPMDGDGPGSQDADGPGSRDADGSDADSGGSGTSRATQWQRFGLGDDPAVGDREAPVVVVAFDAPKCGSCAFWHLYGLPQVEEAYVDTGDVVVVFVQSTIGYSFDYDGGRAMDCTYLHGDDAGYRAFADRVFENQGDFAESTVRDFLRDHAADVGGDAETLVACYDDEETAEAVNEDWLVRDETASGGQTPVFQVFADGYGPTKTSSRDLHDTIDAALA